MKRRLTAAIIAATIASPALALQAADPRIEDLCQNTSKMVGFMVAKRDEGGLSRQRAREIMSERLAPHTVTFITYHVFDAPRMSPEASRQRAWAECVIIGNEEYWAERSGAKRR